MYVHHKFQSKDWNAYSSIFKYCSCKLGHRSNKPPMIYVDDEPMPQNAVEKE